jgi:hypothetical protein
MEKKRGRGKDEEALALPTSYLEWRGWDLDSLLRQRLPPRDLNVDFLAWLPTFLPELRQTLQPDEPGFLEAESRRLALLSHALNDRLLRNLFLEDMIFRMHSSWELQRKREQDQLPEHLSYLQHLREISEDFANRYHRTHHDHVRRPAYVAMDQQYVADRLLTHDDILRFLGPDESLVRPDISARYNHAMTDETLEAYAFDSILYHNVFDFLFVCAFAFRSQFDFYCFKLMDENVQLTKVLTDNQPVQHRCLKHGSIFDGDDQCYWGAGTYNLRSTRRWIYVIYSPWNPSVLEFAAHDPCRSPYNNVQKIWVHLYFWSGPISTGLRVPSLADEDHEECVTTSDQGANGRRFTATIFAATATHTLEYLSFDAVLFN